MDGPGIYFDKAIFVPNQSVYNKVGSNAFPTNDSSHIDLSWQQTLERVWRKAVNSDKRYSTKGMSFCLFLKIIIE